MWNSEEAEAARGSAKGKGIIGNNGDSGAQPSFPAPLPCSQ